MDVLIGVLSLFHTGIPPFTGDDGFNEALREWEDFFPAGFPHSLIHALEDVDRDINILRHSGGRNPRIANHEIARMIATRSEIIEEWLLANVTSDGILKCQEADRKINERFPDGWPTELIDRLRDNTFLIAEARRRRALNHYCGTPEVIAEDESILQELAAHRWVLYRSWRRHSWLERLTDPINIGYLIIGVSIVVYNFGSFLTR